MESLSDFLKNLPNAPGGFNTAKQWKEYVNHPVIEKFRSKYPEIRDEDLKRHATRLHQYLKEYRNCSHCPGLDKCPNDFQGHYTRLSAARTGEMWQIYDHKVSCKKWRAHQAGLQIRKRIRSFYIDERALNEGYSPEEIVSKGMERAKSVDKVIDYIVNTKSQGLQPEGLYLVGNLGTGKTFLMCYLLHELAKNGHTGVIVYMPDFMEDLKSMLQDSAQLKQTVDMLKETDLLVFDDIGAENLKPWARDHVMGTILNYRMNRKPTFFTSNYDLEALEKHFSFTNRDGDEGFKGKRLMDRIRPFVDVIAVKGANQRGKKA